MEELTKSARFAFILLTIANVVVLVTALAAIFSDRFGVAGYLLAALAAPFASPALVALPWFDAWARGEAVNQTIVWLWLPWVLCLIPLTAIALQLRKNAQGRLERRD